MSSIKLVPSTPTTISTPRVGQMSLFIDSSNSNSLSLLDSDRAVLVIGSGGVSNAVSDYKIFDNIAARDDLPSAQRKDGTLVYVKNTSGSSINPSPKFYNLRGGIENTNWVDSFDIKQATLTYGNDGYAELPVPLNFNKSIDVYHRGIRVILDLHYKFESSRKLVWLDYNGVAIEPGENLIIKYYE